MNNLIERIKDLIEYERQNNPDIQYVNASHANLIAQIIDNYHLSQTPKTDSIPSAKMIYLAAPTGAGKDTLVRKIMADNKSANFVVLNMDMFRHYHQEITGENKPILDKDYASVTNQSSYELYYLVQEILLREFPGTNIIVTGTMRDLDWVREIAERYRSEKRSKYSTTLVTLAVPIAESAFSIFERYLRMVKIRDNSTPLRYTDLKYHNDTVKKFEENLGILEGEFKQDPENSLFDSIQVYRRSQNILDLSEDTIIYNSDNKEPNKSALSCVHQIMHSLYVISPKRTSRLLEIAKANKDYLKSQGLFKSILVDLKQIISKEDDKSEPDIEFE